MTIKDFKETEKKDEEQDRVKPERMDHIEKGAEIGKPREKKEKNKMKKATLFGIIFAATVFLIGGGLITLGFWLVFGG